MKILNKVVIGMASLCLLTACGPTKVDYDKFHEAAVEAAKKENGYTKVVVDGKAKLKEDGKVTEYTFDKIEFTGFTNGRLSAAEKTAKMIGILAEGNEAKLIAFTYANLTAELMPKDDKSTYYTGGFQVTAEDDGQKATIKFDANGLPTSYKLSGDASGSVSFKWSK